MPTPTAHELKLLKPLWQHDRLSARELHDLTVAETGWSYSTTRKTLYRLEDKGLIKTELVHGLKIYRPVRTKLDTLAALIADFSKNILETEQPLPAATFAHSKLISKAEIAELRKILDKHQEDSKQ